MPHTIKITSTPFDPVARLGEFTKSNKDAGAINSFLGQVRAESGNVETLFLEHYPGVTESGIKEAVASALKRWPLSDVMVIHRTGSMGIGEPIVMVATAAKHRRAAFLACDYLMDYLKTQAIFWKRQTGVNGTTWIEPRSQDYADNKRWR